MNSKALESLLDGLHYEELTIKEKADLLAGMKNILSVYPELAQNQHIMQYFSLNLSYKGFKKAREIYQMLNEDVLNQSIKLISECDTLIVAGTSLTVEPASSLVKLFKGKNLIIINRDATSYDNIASLVINDEFKNIFKYLK